MNGFFCGNWSCYAARLSCHFACTRENGDVVCCEKLAGVRVIGLQDRSSSFSLQPFEQVAYSPSPQQASRSNPRPHFHEGTQNDVTTAWHSWISFRKKTFVYYQMIQPFFLDQSITHAIHHFTLERIFDELY